eukprot:Gregarina_sp_Poly_1__1523@NODE_1383_length_4248_cov_66_729491_g927_i0_p1_GENE_NODE_1383_length_4248_cov_66_729491_g927_i0NODE_1383_length_4248_cov_66_729491_g927_i0_p1_ORF_typecomplete_len825_score122_78Myb_DNAbinding/PF00249_31/0_18Myb_DNAbinding/PF00249_31/0_00087Myb_DNAbinding/PF00249_31/5_5e07Myb_DNAbinding/PF00249_31/1_8e11Myb_DNAbinding/PF00249_31/2_1e10Myb_DNAbind_6/PF13921_6/1_1e03Myb_DNAbind_6/PF13921_6/0_059Myb_DNAbind_6/PF13921_6/9_8e08Myb_DNAbind_6/PF13921_6/1e10Myb_DNAbind_6/PF13921
MEELTEKKLDIPTRREHKRWLEETPTLGPRAKRRRNRQSDASAALASCNKSNSTLQSVPTAQSAQSVKSVQSAESENPSSSIIVKSSSAFYLEENGDLEDCGSGEKVAAMQKVSCFVDCYSDYDSISMGWPSSPDNDQLSSLESRSVLENEYLDLLRAETVLLRFCKTLRLILHALKANSTRLQMWYDVKTTRENVLKRSKTQEETRIVFRRILQELPKEPGPVLPGLRAMKMRTTTTTRKWSPAEEERLILYMTDALVQALAKHRVQQLPPEITVDEIDVIRRDTKEIIGAQQGSLSAPQFLVQLMEQMDIILGDAKKENPEKNISAWWQDFWESVAGNFASRSGRETQIHFVHWIDPRINRNPEWDKKEEAKILELVHECLETNRTVDWDFVAEKLGTGRTKFAVYHRYQTALNTELTCRQWTPEQDEKLISLVENYTEDRRKVWSYASERFEDKTNEQCRSRYELLTRDAKKGNWILEEDLKLQVLVALFGRGQWAKIAALVPDRTDVKCRERYENMLAPEIERRPWTTEESNKLMELVKQNGPGNWAVLVEHFEGRTDSDLWRQWQRLDPMGNVNYGGSRAVKRIFLPTQNKLRGALPALEDSDFSCEIADQLAVLTRRAIKQLEFKAPSKRRFRRRFGPASEDRLRRSLSGVLDSTPAPLKQDDDTSPETTQNGELQIANLGTDWDMTQSEMDTVRRLALFERFLEFMGTGNKDADLDLAYIRKNLIRKKEQVHSLPRMSTQLGHVTETEVKNLKLFIDAGLTMRSFIEYDRIYGSNASAGVISGDMAFPDRPEFSSLSMQALLGQLLCEFSCGMQYDV